MSAQSKRNTEETSEEWADPGTLKGLLVGLWQTTLAGVIIALAFLIVVLNDTLPPFSADPGIVAYLGGVCGIGIGIGSLLQYYRSTPSEWRTDIRWQAASLIGFAVAFIAFFAFVPAMGVLAALGYLAGRLLMHICLYAAS